MQYSLVKIPSLPSFILLANGYGKKFLMKSRYIRDIAVEEIKSTNIIFSCVGNKYIHVIIYNIYSLHSVIQEIIVDYVLLSIKSLATVNYGVNSVA